MLKSSTGSWDPGGIKNVKICQEYFLTSLKGGGAFKRQLRHLRHLRQLRHLQYYRGHDALFCCIIGERGAKRTRTGTSKLMRPCVWGACVSARARGRGAGAPRRRRGGGLRGDPRFCLRNVRRHRFTISIFQGHVSDLEPIWSDSGVPSVPPEPGAGGRRGEGG